MGKFLYDKNCSFFFFFLLSQSWMRIHNSRLKFYVNFRHKKIDR